jgi:uncharacterized protein (DUF58 family)
MGWLQNITGKLGSASQLHPSDIPRQQPTANSQLALDASQENRKKLRRIEIKTRKLSNQIFSGSYHSAFKGRGISFSEVREYQYGDDIRSIDWNVTARAGKPFIKVFEEERELTLMLLIDVSRSTLFGTQSEFKKEIIEVISGILAFSAITNNDKVGVLFFSDRVERFIPPKKGKSHIMRIITEIDHFQSTSTGTSIAGALKHFNNANKKKAIAFMISDFMSPENYERDLRIASSRHDFIGIQVYDKRERELDNIGTMLLQDAETGEQFYLDTSDAKMRADVQKRFDLQQRHNKEVFGKCGSQYVSIDTTTNYVTSLMKMFKEREVKR